MKTSALVLLLVLVVLPISVLSEPAANPDVKIRYEGHVTCFGKGVSGTIETWIDFHENRFDAVTQDRMLAAAKIFNGEYYLVMLYPILKSTDSVWLMNHPTSDGIKVYLRIQTKCEPNTHCKEMIKIFPNDYYKAGIGAIVSRDFEMCE